MGKNLIKGALLVDFARLIRANEKLPWDKYLTPDDIRLVKGKIMPSSWYPLEFFERMGYATFMIIGRGDLKNARAFGAFSAQETFYNVYKDVLFIEGENPMSILDRFVKLRRQFFRYDDPSLLGRTLEQLGDNKAIIRVSSPEVGDFIEPYAHHLAGSLEKLLEIVGAKNPEVEVLKVQSQKEPDTIIEVSWDAA